MDSGQEKSLHLGGKERGKLVLVDGNSLLYRAYFALPSLLTSEGVPTGGVYGFTNILFKLLEEEKPDYLAFTFDRRGPTFRHLQYSLYKANRPKTPSELLHQVILAKELAEALRVPVFEKEGFEADDCIATLARLGEEEGLSVTILTGDLDTLQLIDEQVTVLTPLKGVSETFRYDKDAVRARFHLEPSQFLDYKALIGDPSDNIPRIPGIGEKTAQALLTQFGSIDGIYERIEEVEPKLRKILLESHEQVEQNRKLASLVDNLELEVDWELLKVKEWDQEKAAELFSRLEFKSLLKKLAPVEEEQLQVNPLEDVSLPGPLAFIFFGEDPPVLSLARGDVVYAGELATSSFDLFACSDSTLPESVQRLLADPEREKWTHDLKQAWKFCKERGWSLEGVRFDTLLASYLLNSARSSHTLEQIFLEKTKRPLWQENERLSTVKHAALSARAVYHLKPLLEEELSRVQLDRLYYDLELPLSLVLAQMEIAGVKVSRPVLEELRVEAEGKLRQLEGEIYALCGCQFNISSPKQLGVVLFEKLQLPRGRRTKTGYSTDASVLESLAPTHPAVQKILQYRELFKLKTTYIDAIPLLLDQEDHVHTTFLQTSTATGRLSSVNPNLQNIPIRSEFGGQIRRAFISSSADHLLLSADYSQIELRVLAHLSADPDLIETFAREGDIHSDTACHVFGVSPDQVSAEMRRMAKVINFGIIYGMSAYGLSQALTIPVDEAQAYIEAYFLEHPGVKEYLESILIQGREEGYVCTILGRRRYIPDLNSRNRKLAQMAERAALNAPIQGSAADIIKLAMLNLYKEIVAQRLKSRIVLQVHDELLLDCPRDEIKLLIPVVRKVMEEAFSLSVPLKVDVKVGSNWFQMEKVDA